MIAIIDYGEGNTMSVMNALDRLNAEYVLTDSADTILSATKVILPGVGHASHAMNVLKAKGLDNVIKKAKMPLLGICLGMHLLYEYSEEGQTECLVREERNIAPLKLVIFCLLFVCKILIMLRHKSDFPASIRQKITAF